MDKLNVCLINDSFPPMIDGVANAVTNYAQIITRSHGRAAVVTPYYPDADDSVYPFPVFRYPSLDLTKYVGYRAGMPFSPELMQKLKEQRFDLIHSHCPVASTMLARVLREHICVPLVFTDHTKFDIDIANVVRSKLLQEEAARLLVANVAACDEVWTVSRGAGENLEKLGYQGEWSVMPNGVDFPRGRVSEEQIAQIGAACDLPAELPLFLFVGRMMWYKGIRIILDALKALRESGRDFRMVFVGGGGDKDEIVDYCASLGLSDCVFFEPPIRDRELIRAWYCRADLFLFPSTFDTNGLVVREAAACALPSVLVRGSCAAEDVTDGVNGFLIEENADSMAAMLRELIGERETMKRVGEYAQRELYISWEESVARAYERYGAVLERWRGGGYPEHANFSDEVFRATAQAMDSYNRAHERLLDRRHELEAERRALREELQSGRGEMLRGLKDGGQELLRDLKGSGQELLSGAMEKRRKVLESLEDYYDRFL